MIIKAAHIAKSFGKNEVLLDVSFELESGKLYGIVGENGSGKSTLLKIMVGQWKANKGSITINGCLGYCPQQPLIFSQLTVDENFQYFSEAYGLPRIKGQEQRERLLRHFCFEKYRREKVMQLSGGTQQKLNLSLSLLHQPDVLILDEPYSGFDWETYLRFWEYTDQLLERGCTIMIVTHFVNETDRFYRIFNLKNGILE